MGGDPSYWVLAHQDQLFGMILCILFVISHSIKNFHFLSILDLLDALSCISSLWPWDIRGASLFHYEA